MATLLIRSTVMPNEICDSITGEHSDALECRYETCHHLKIGKARINDRCSSGDTTDKTF